MFDMRGRRTVCNASSTSFLDSERARRLPEAMRRASIVLLSLIVLPTIAGAQCTTKTDASAVRKSIKHAASCNYKKLRNGPATTCKTTAPPACAGSLVADAIALAWGANNPRQRPSTGAP
jgi:hypothetical protein